MNEVAIKYGSNPKLFKWNEMVNAIYHNLGNKAGNTIVHFAVDTKAARDYLGQRHPDYKNCLSVDPALELDISESYPEDELEYLSDLLFFRSFLFDTSDVEEISEWIYNHFFESPSYIWINGTMSGGLCFPQATESRDEFPPLKEKLSDFVCIKP
jgi:hypothetical protein